MQQFNLNIDRAQLTGFSVSFSEGQTPEISGTIGLIAGAKQISSYSVRNSFWADDKVEFPPKVLKHIKAIAEIIEEVVVRECNKSLKQLPAGTFDA